MNRDASGGLFEDDAVVAEVEAKEARELVGKRVDEARSGFLRSGVWLQESSWRCAEG